MIVDSNVVIGMVNAAAGSGLLERMSELRSRQAFHVNEIIFAETASGFANIDQVKALFAFLDMTVTPLSLDECFRAGHAYAEYRRRQGQRTAILPDFLIGAQAAVRGWPLVTRDRRGFASYFPEVELIDPFTAEP